MRRRRKSPSFPLVTLFSKISINWQNEEILYADEKYESNFFYKKKLEYVNKNCLKEGKK